MTQQWRQVLIKPHTSLKETIEVIDKAALQIALVVNDASCLLGVVTDGDIRRALIKGLSLKTPIDQVMNPNAKTLGNEASKSQQLAFLRRNQVLHLPLVDAAGKVTGLATLRELYQPETLSNPVVLLAGGFGRRLRPWTNDCPKPLLEIGGKPILQTIIESLAKAGFNNFYIAVHYLAEQIKSYFGDGEQWGVSIRYIEEMEPLGTAGAIGLLPDDAPDLPILVMNGDILTQVDFQNLLRYHSEQQGYATLCVRQYEYQIPYGVVSLDDHTVTAIQEKPVHRCFSSAGIYVLARGVVSDIRRKGRCDIPDLLNQCIDEGRLICSYPIHEYWLDIGKEADFLRAQGEFAKFF